MRRHYQELRPLTEMNVTNLLDTAFILLMAFMIVAPALKHGIELELPSVRGENLDSIKTVTVVIQKPAAPGGPDRIYIEDRRYSLEELGEELRRRRQLFPELDVLLEADKAVPWDTIAKTMSTIRQAGIAQFGAVLEPELGGPAS